MANTLSGMLTADLLNPIQQAPLTGQQAAMQRMQDSGTRLRKGMSGMFGSDLRTTTETVQDELTTLMSSPGFNDQDPESQRKLITLVAQVNKPKAAQMAAQFAENNRKLTAAQEAQTKQTVERGALADFLELEYGEKATRMRPAIMSGSINVGNMDKVFKAEEKVSRTPKNVTYTDDQGNVQKQLVFMDTQGRTYDQANNPIVLPDDAQLTMTGQTPQDVAPGISKFSPKELARVREDILTSRMQLRTLAPVTEEAIDKYLSFLGKGKAGVGKVLSSATGLGGDFVNEMLKQATGGTDLIEFAGEQGVLFGTLENYFNKKKHDITGAAAAASELRDIRKGLLGGELEPTVAKARLKKVIEEEQYKLDTNFGLLKSNGLDVNAYFDKPVDKNESSGQTASKKIDSKSQLNAPKMEAANRVKNLLSGISLEEEL